MRASRNVEQCEPPIRVSTRAEVGPDDRYFGIWNGGAGRGRGNAALDAPTLGGGELGREGQAQGDRESDMAHEHRPVEADKHGEASERQTEGGHSTTARWTKRLRPWVRMAMSDTRIRLLLRHI